MTIKELKKCNKKLLSELAELKTANNAFIDENKELKVTNDNLTQRLNYNVEKSNIDILAYKLNWLLSMTKCGGCLDVNLIFCEHNYDLEQQHNDIINMATIIKKLYIDVANLIKKAEMELKEYEKAK